jgi:DNA-binding NarL/FixJ family response regulator
VDEAVLGEIVREAHDHSLATQAGLSSVLSAIPQKPSLLSRREREVHNLISQGFTNKRIAETLFISESTVKVHVRHIFEKLNVRSRTEAALLWRERET